MKKRAHGSMGLPCAFDLIALPTQCSPILRPGICQQCGAGKVEFVVPHGDDRERHACGECGHIHYLNPKLVVGTLPV